VCVWGPEVPHPYRLVDDDVDTRILARVIVLGRFASVSHDSISRD